MAKTFQLIVPTIAETELTGFRGAMEKTYRGHAYRVEFWPAGLALKRDGEQVRAWDDLPKSIQKAAQSARDVLDQGAKMAKPRTYFTLVSREDAGAPWVIEFGDYARSVVKQEKDDRKDGDFCDHAFRIISTNDDQASIDAAVAELNRGLSA